MSVRYCPFPYTALNGPSDALSSPLSMIPFCPASSV